MDLSPEVLVVVIPSVVALVLMYLMHKNFTDSLKAYFDEELKKRKEESRSIHHSMVAPLRIQSYERMVLFLERIVPAHIAARLHHGGMTAVMLQAEIIRNIRIEYEHNIAQQVYLSIPAWEIIKTAKEETIKLVNVVGDKMPEAATGMDFGEALINNSAHLKKLPTQVAIEYLKTEFAQEF
jgi:hypothetical protein